MRHQFTTTRTVKIKKLENSKSWQGYKEKGILVQCWWEYKIVQPLRKRVWRGCKEIRVLIHFFGGIQNAAAVMEISDGSLKRKSRITI